VHDSSVAQVDLVDEGAIIFNIDAYALCKHPNGQLSTESGNLLSTNTNSDRAPNAN